MAAPPSIAIEFFSSPHKTNKIEVDYRTTEHSHSHSFVSVAPAMMNSSEEFWAPSVAVTLLVRHLPESIPLDTLTRLFSHYGASSVRPFSHGRLVCFALLCFLSLNFTHQFILVFLFTRFSTSISSTLRRVRNCAYVDFKDEISAYQAQNQLHGYYFIPPFFHNASCTCCL